ncbi:putative methionine-R-sulfoxide reductase with GAF domain [Lipingzhangella halophila]|uniref:Putative methionine-R-sulfoxide reductase with GAF domain n=1 Tax=Lipingzhangella halophila TaxID=1783352 RepID=A0A7W7W3W9_9ACTN|nr:helix-turn-helix domain-containing protein [Lipingzhangella halophila]MBB4932983.1 putative methionine-R-sulfoxide reductase with GAF domain [Lipingzhangella halophila]
MDAWHDGGTIDAATMVAALDLVAAGRHVSTGEVRHRLDPEGAAPEVPDEVVQHIVGAAARVASWRRREAEWAALTSSARELAELRDVQTLLRRLVERAHDLMGTDVTYLSEYDEATDELWVRATRGAVSADLNQLRVPAGVGLASKVVHTRTAQWTADYGTELELARDTEVDAAVRAEEMHSLLGVPMVASGRVLGVLFAADRSAHTFSADEISLLSAFADHAAVILYTARLLAAERSSAAAAEAAHARAEQHAADIERSALLHEDLTRLVLSGKGAREVVETLARSLGCPVALADRDLRREAATDGAPDTWWDSTGRARPRVRDALERSRQSGHCVDAAGAPDRNPPIVVAVVAGDTHLGGLLVAAPNGGLAAVQRRTVERAAQIVALLTMREQAVAEAEARGHGELVADLVSGRGSIEDAARRARARNIRLDRSWSAVAVLSGADRYGVGRVLRSAAPEWLVGDYREGTVVLMPAEVPRDAARSVHRRLAAASLRPAVAVAADRAVGPEGIAEEVRAAWECAELLPGLGIRDAAAVAGEFAPYLAMFGPGAERAADFVDLTVGRVIDWDTRHGSELMPTLECFAARNGNVARTARDLFVHVNTVKQRLDRVTALLGAGWRDPEAFFRVSVAVRLHRLRRDPSGNH